MYFFFAQAIDVVVVLFVFVSIMLPLRLSLITTSSINYLINYSIWFFVLISLLSNNYIMPDNFNFFDFRIDVLQMFGLLIYTQKAWYFMIAAVLLTIAMIGAILLTQNTLSQSEMKEVINLQLNKNFSADLSLYS